MSRKRISDNLGSHTQATFSGSLYAQFQEYFDILLESEHSAEAEQAFLSTYVQNPNVEKPLERFINRRKNSITAFLGSAGIGKSTTLRKLFGVIGQPCFSAFSSETLVLPFYLDSYNLRQINPDPALAVESIITSQVLAAVEFAGEKKGVSISDENLIKFIRTHKRQLLTNINLSRAASASEKIEWLRKNRPYAYVAEELKYICHNSDIDRVILIVDDIESTSYLAHKEIILGTLKLRECLKSTGEVGRSYKVEIIISCRPATFEKLSNDNTINGFSVRRPIYMHKPVSIDRIVEKRFDMAIKEIGEGRVQSHNEKPAMTSDLGAWRSSYAVLKELIDKISTSHGELISELSNYDMRQALREILEILENSRWYEKRNHNEGAIEIFEENYRATDAGILRAIALKGYNSYIPHKNSAFPNIFHNFRNPGLDLFVVMAIRFFGERSRNGKFTPIRFSELRDALMVCFDEYLVVEKFDELVSHLNWSGVVRVETVPDDGANDGGRFLIAQRRGFTTLNLLKETSVVLEILRDNTFINSDSSSRTGLGTGTTLISPPERFLHVGDFIEQIADSEKRIYERVSEGKAEEIFEDRFGQPLVAYRCLLGFEKSIKRYFFDRNTRRAKVPRSVTAKQKAVRDYLRGRQLLPSH